MDDIRQQAARLHAVLDSFPDSIRMLRAVRDANGRLIDFEWQFANAAARHRYGDPSGRQLLRDCASSPEAAHFGAFRDAAETGAASELESRQESDGREEWTLHLLAKLEDGVVITSRDITQSRLEKLEVLAQNRRLRETQALGRTGDFYFDPATDTVQWSDELYRLMGVPAGTPMSFEKAIGFYVGDDGRILAAKAAECLQTGLPFEMEARFQPAGSGEEKILFVRAAAVQTGSGTGIRGVVQDITEQKQSESRMSELNHALTQRATDKYLSLFNSMDEGYCIIHLLYDAAGKPVNWRFLEVNPAFERHNGLSGAAGKTILELTPGIEQVWMDIYGRVARTGESIRFQQDSDALGRIFDLYAFRIGLPEEQTVAVLFTDITARRQAEVRQQYLLAVSDAIRSLADAGAVEAAVTQLAMERFRADRCYYFQIEQGQAIIRQDAVRGTLPSVAGTYALADFPRFRELVDAGSPFSMENALAEGLLDPPLRALCIELSVVSFIGVPVVKGGTTAGVLCLVQAIPRSWTAAEIELAAETAERIWAAVERAEAVEALRRNENRLAAMFQALPVAAGFMDREGKVVVANEEMRRYLPTGLIPSRDPDRSHRWQAFHADGRPVLPHEFPGARALRGEFVVPGVEMLFTADDGSRHWARFASVPFRDGEENIIGVVSLISDITQLKEAAEALRRLVKMKDEFIGNASHELKTPVTSIRMYGELVEAGLQSAGDSRNAAMVAKLNQQVERLSALIAALLDATSIEQGRFSYDKAYFPLHALISECVEEMTLSAGRRRLRMELRGAPVVLADRQRIAQVLTNLLSNAIKYSADGSTITVSCIGDAGQARVEVRDEGIGMPPEALDRVFERFYRVESAAMNTYPGMGLGLYISSEIIRGHGGSISASSREGEGSVFQFTLPLSS